ncbi:MazG nucleotide pyrophosphohydrolase domain-containing protein [Labrenzia sp. CP4]|jgi:NTP pyrophosphatase (non-canonical NTP hydrolase)/phosphopantetheinyl transferase (holo-ACP synthase)|uniref:MazG nucleotide pyrophosphohydrolase domain-containing protein n=1 Tax=Labrenzia sp. CP4 TaxID=1674922 RepID=UPI00078403AE|nr:MazG nucleotide pyrophosphohydrolase domain-containing protein [Labrenzia sp. CP4]
MLIARYAKRVAETDQFKGRSSEDHRRISIYGLVSEIGSVISAVKKQKLGEGGQRDTTEGILTRHELKEELGDVIWYCFALATQEEGSQENILAQQLQNLLDQLQGDDPNTAFFIEQLDETSLEEFRRQAEMFPSKKRRTFADFQKIAYLTARTKSDELVEICLAVLMQLGAQLMRLLLPESERRLHDQVQDRKVLDILGEIAWHLAAIATVYKISLDEVAAENIQKAQLRRPTTKPTPLHDENSPESQRFPRFFEVKFLTVGQGRSRMYLNGRQFGDDLTDNAYEEDGYRFHDVLHLANIAHLGWSPVFRGLMKRKRKDPSNPKIDEVEDGARAKIVEEALLKVIHSEGNDIAAIVHPNIAPKNRPMFTDDVDIPLSFFKLIARYVKGLEVEKNSFEEWKAAIRDGYRIYRQLAEHGQGTVALNLENREITFRPEVYIDLVGAVAGIGSYAIPLAEFDENYQAKARSALTKAECERLSDSDTVRLAKHYAAKRAILHSLNIDEPTTEFFSALDLTETEHGKYSVRSAAPLQDMMWEGRIIAFKTSVVRSQNSVYCTALASSDIVTG